MPAISNPFYELQGYSPLLAGAAAALNSQLPSNQVDTAALSTGGTAAASLGGLLSSWRSKSHPGLLDQGNTRSTATAASASQVSWAGRFTVAGGAAGEFGPQSSRGVSYAAVDKPASCSSEAPCLY